MNLPNLKIEQKLARGYKPFISLAVAAIVSLSTYGQDTNWIPSSSTASLMPSESSHWIVSTGIAYQGLLSGEINAMHSNLTLGCTGFFMRGARYGLEINANRQHFIYTPKIGYEAAAMGLMLRGNVLAHIQGRAVDIRLLPEAGFSLGLVTLSYGYSLPILNHETTQISRHRVALIINIENEFW